MKALIVAFLTSLIFAASSVAAPPPGETADPYTNYIVTRVLPNGNERVLGTGTVTEWGEPEQVIRAAVFAFAEQQRINNPSWRVIIYGPIDFGTYWTDDDRIWDSLFNL